MRAWIPLAPIVAATIIAQPAISNPPIRVLFLGGGSTSHNPAAMRDVMEPVLERAGMLVDYRTNESVLQGDSLSRYDVIFVYNAKKGSKTDNTPDLTRAQEDALYKWVEAGRAMVAVHGATSSYLENPRWAELLGASYTEHGNDLASITLAKPEHPALQGVSAPTGWDEGRVHRLLKQDLTLLATANAEKTPWTWVRPQGKGWVYYTSSGHDNRVWSDVKFQGQLVQAVKWAYEATQPPTGLFRRAPSSGAKPPSSEGADALGRFVPTPSVRFAPGRLP